MLENRKVIQGRYEANGRSNNYPKPLQCCKVENYPDLNLHYDPRFFGNILTDQICLETPESLRPFGDLVHSLDANVTRSSELQASFKQILDDSPEIKWQYYGGMWCAIS